MAKKDTKLENLSKAVHMPVEESRIPDTEGLDCYVRDVIAADGKETRHTAKKHGKELQDLCSLNEFNVMSMEWGICLSSTRIDGKTNEIPEMQAVMKGLGCRSCIVTADAMNAQKETARVIVQEAHGDYCLALKGNQKQAYGEVRNYFTCVVLLENMRQKAGQYQSETEKSIYAVTVREYFITDDIQWFEDRCRWEKLQSIRYERKTITIKETGESHIDRRVLLSVQHQTGCRVICNSSPKALKHREQPALDTGCRIQGRQPWFQRKEGNP